MALPGFFKQKAPNRFDYTPIYWDPDKEAREERINRIKAELGYDMPRMKKSSTITRGSFRQYAETNRRAKKESSRRLLLIIVFLVLIFFLLFYR